jgi:hypothetical protein
LEEWNQMKCVISDMNGDEWFEDSE